MQKRIIKGCGERKKAMKLMIPPSLLRVVQKEAKQRRISMNEVVRECVAEKMRATGRF